VHFNFESYEFVQKSDWDELHAHKKIYGVIGLVDCGAEGSLESAYRTFSDSVKPYVEWADAPTTLSGIATAAAAKEKSGRRASVSSRDKAVSVRLYLPLFSVRLSNSWRLCSSRADSALLLSLAQSKLMLHTKSLR
jgi:hypothetical protein